MNGSSESKSLTALLVRCQQIAGRLSRHTGKPPVQEVLELEGAVQVAYGAARGSKLSEQQSGLTWEVVLDIWVQKQSK